MNLNHFNWAGNLTYRANAVLSPRTREEVQETVANHAKVKALGSRHSFCDVADTDGIHISLDRMRGIVGLDREANEVTVEAGIRYGELAEFLFENGYALHNLASLPHISVGGAVATATHGSGDRLGNLATIVRSLRLVLADGTMEQVSRESHGDRFAGMVVHLGALGVVTDLTLEVEPAYEVRQDVYEHLSVPAVQDSFDAITAAGTSVSLFSTWTKNAIDQIWIKRRNEADSLGDAFLGARLADGPRHPLPGMPTENCTEQQGRWGAWHERLPHFRMQFTPSGGEELQSEYLLPRIHAAEALGRIAALREKIAPHLFVAEIRTMAGDDLWLSNAYGGPTVGFHFTWKPHLEAVLELLPEIEHALDPFTPRPHWGKLSTMPSERIEEVFPRFNDFRNLRSELDPNQKFSNRYLVSTGVVR